MIRKSPKPNVGQDVEKFVVRLPRGMRARIAEVSRLSHRSMNSEIVARLEQSLQVARLPEEPAAQPLKPVADSGLRDQESRLLAGFRSLDPVRRRALIEFLQGQATDN